MRVGNTLLLVVRDAEPYGRGVCRLSAEFLGLPRDSLAGPTLSQTWDQASRAASLPQPVLVLGESGSGKESIARIIHRASGKTGTFVALNIAAIPEGLFEAEAFGHERGAYTGANAQRLGVFREAQDGVLFLDEIGDLQPDLQVKLLRVLDSSHVRPLGARGDTKVNVRLVAATNRDLRSGCADGQFRLDLYYRLSGIVIKVPPLRERREDILLVAHAALRESAPQLSLSVGAAEALVLAPWDGNVRALFHAIAHASAAALSESAARIYPHHLPDLRTIAALPGEPITKDAIAAAMARSNNVAGRAAAHLGVSRATFYNACKRLGITPASFRAPRGVA